ncbi:MAG: efflux RND transporter periplasmic adaptor subunit, partial [Phycisphaerales bacterium]|nr:efflux RND transporter periplasmic adaptor subunit [Phycisphaerales bacterium]
VVSGMPVRQGDRVGVGDRLVKLNDGTLRFELAEAEALLAAREKRVWQWSFEVDRVKNLFDVAQANDKEWRDTQADFEVARHGVAEQQAVVSRLKSNLAKTEIAAPFAGHVIALHTEVGQWVEHGGAVVEMLDLSRVLVRVEAPEFAYAFVQVGQPVTVGIDALKAIRSGTVQHIIPQADAHARTFPVEIVVDNADGALASGMFARATVRSGANTELPAVPKDAIVERDGVRYVGMVIAGQEGGSAAVLSPVTTGADVGDWVAITSDNLRPGMDVVIRGNEGLLPFPMPIRIVDEHGTPVGKATGASGR